MKADKSTGGQSMEQLLERMKKLEEQSAKLKIALDDKDKKILELEAKAEASGADAMTIMGRQVMERYLGKRKVPSKTYDHKKKEYVDGFTEIDMFEYLIDLAPNQGLEVKINGIPFAHNTAVEVDTNTLRTLKDIIAKGWWHEAQINGNQEAKFRRQVSAVLSGKTGGRVA